MNKKAISELKEAYMFRENEIDRLAKSFKLKSIRCPIKLIYGRSETGKTSILKSLVSTFKLEHVWINCMSNLVESEILNIILTEIKELRKIKEKIKKRKKKNYFHDLFTQWCSPDKGPIHIILDNCDFLMEKDLNFLYKLHQWPNINIKLILISRNGYQWISKISQPLEVIHFRAYTFDQTEKIMEKYLKSVTNKDEVQIKRFMRNIVLHYVNYGFSINFLKASFKALFEEYWEPVASGKVDEKDINELNRLFKSKISEFRTSVISGKIYTTKNDTKLDITTKSNERFETLQFNSKVLLLSGFICSWNHQRYDAHIFDVSKKASKRRKKEGKSKYDTKEKFDFERLHMVFRSLINIINLAMNEDYMNEYNVYKDRIIYQFNSLLTMQYFTKISGSWIEDSKYRCEIEKDFAHKLANNLNLKLDEYLI